MAIPLKTDGFSSLGSAMRRSLQRSHFSLYHKPRRIVGLTLLLAFVGIVWSIVECGLAPLSVYASVMAPRLPWLAPALGYLFLCLLMLGQLGDRESAMRGSDMKQVELFESGASSAPLSTKKRILGVTLFLGAALLLPFWMSVLGHQVSLLLQGEGWALLVPALAALVLVACIAIGTTSTVVVGVAVLVAIAVVAWVGITGVAGWLCQWLARSPFINLAAVLLAGLLIGLSL